MRIEKDIRNLKDGRTLKSYHCKRCNNKITYQSALYGSGMCRSCATKSQMKNSRNNGRYIDGRTLKKYYCEVCGKEISYNSGIYGKGKCYLCSQKHKKLSEVAKAKMRQAKLKYNNILTKKFLIKEYVKKNKSESQIAKQIKCSNTTIRRYLKIFKIPKIYENRKGRNAPMFGKPAPHGKKIRYKDILMRSSWETCFAQFLDCSNIKWIYEPKTFDLDNTTYTPDFYLPEFDCYIEIKGWWRDNAKKKFRKFKEKHPKENIKVLMKKELKTIGIIR